MIRSFIAMLALVMAVGTQAKANSEDLSSDFYLENEAEALESQLDMECESDDSSIICANDTTGVEIVLNEEVNEDEELVSTADVTQFEIMGKDSPKKGKVRKVFKGRPKQKTRFMKKLKLRFSKHYRMQTRCPKPRAHRSFRLPRLDLELNLPKKHSKK